MNEPEWDLYLQQFENLDETYFTKISGSTNKHCVIIEPRCHPKLIAVIKNFMYLLQEYNWGLIIFHGTDNESYIRSELNGWKNVKYVKMNVSNLNPLQYNKILFSSIFWETLEKIKCEHALMFQTDTILLKPNIDDFLHYDYIGAPWFKKWLDVVDIGNGGLSLRKVKTMKMLTQKYLVFPMNEDVWFSYVLLEEKKRNNNINLPTIDVAKQFSVETIFYQDPCGMHKPHIDKFSSNKQEFLQILSKRYVNK